MKEEKRLGFLDLFRKKPKDQEQPVYTQEIRETQPLRETEQPEDFPESESESAETRTPEFSVCRFDSDQAEYQWDTALEKYCEEFNRSPEELTDEDEKIVWEYAGNHLAFFLTWIIQNDFIGELHEELGDEDDIEAVKREELRGIDFLMNNCDNMMTREDFSDEILDFVDAYYEENYMSDYSDFMEDKLDKPVLGTAFSWEDYNAFKPVLDNAYKSYQNYKKQ